MLEQSGKCKTGNVKAEHCKSMGNKIRRRREKNVDFISDDHGIIYAEREKNDKRVKLILEKEEAHFRILATVRQRSGENETKAIQYKNHSSSFFYIRKPWRRNNTIENTKY